VSAEKVHELTTTCNILSKTAVSQTNWFTHFGENGESRFAVKFYHCIPEAKRGRGRPYEGKEQF
jgi:hypothetical protein